MTIFVIGFWLTTLISAIIIFILIASKKLLLGRDFFFLCSLAQIFIYLHMAPSVCLLDIMNDKYSRPFEEGIDTNYFIVGVCCLLFFEIPLLYNYLKLQKLHQIVNLNREIKINNKILLMMSIIFLVAPIIFLKISLQEELFFKRIGHQAYRNRLSDLSVLDGLVYRYYYKTALFVLAIYLIAIMKAKSILYRAIFFIVFTVNLLIYGAYDFINNRLTSMLMILYLSAIYWFIGTPKNLSLGLPIRKIVTIFVILLLSSKSVVSIRTGFTEKGFVDVSDLNPFRLSQEEQGDPFSWRLNGVDLVARLLPKLIDDPIPRINPYFESFTIAFGGIWGSKFSEEKKDDLATTIKSRLIIKYLNWDGSADYYSCCITDTFSCLKIVGLLFLGFFLSFLYFKTTYALFYSNNINLFFLGLFFMPILLPFEYETTTLYFAWIRLLPILIIIIIFKPFRFLKINEKL